MTSDTRPVVRLRWDRDRIAIDRFNRSGYIIKGQPVWSLEKLRELAKAIAALDAEHASQSNT